MVNSFILASGETQSCCCQQRMGNSGFARASQVQRDQRAVSSMLAAVPLLVWDHHIFTAVQGSIKIISSWTLKGWRELQC